MVFRAYTVVRASGHRFAVTAVTRVAVVSVGFRLALFSIVRVRERPGTGRGVGLIGLVACARPAARVRFNRTVRARCRGADSYTSSEQNPGGPRRVPIGRPERAEWPRRRE